MRHFWFSPLIWAELKNQRCFLCTRKGPSLNCLTQIVSAWCSKNNKGSSIDPMGTPQFFDHWRLKKFVWIFSRKCFSLVEVKNLRAVLVFARPAYSTDMSRNKPVHDALDWRFIHSRVLKQMVLPPDTRTYWFSEPHLWPHTVNLWPIIVASCNHHIVRSSWVG